MRKPKQTRHVTALASSSAGRARGLSASHSEQAGTTQRQPQLLRDARPPRERVSPAELLQLGPPPTHSLPRRSRSFREDSWTPDHCPVETGPSRGQESRRVTGGLAHIARPRWSCQRRAERWQLQGTFQSDLQRGGSVCIHGRRPTADPGAALTTH